MSHYELIEKILYLIPEAKFSIWENDRSQYMGESEPILLSNLLVCWGRNNTVPPPAQDQLDMIDMVALNAKKEADRKLARDARYQNDISVIASYRIALNGNPALTFSEFLDGVEQEL